MATRWLDGLLNKDLKITNEVYAIHTVDFDRQVSRMSPPTNDVYCKLLDENYILDEEREMNFFTL